MLLSFYIETRGCPKNSVDSRQIAAHLIKDGFQPVSESAQADIIIVNTCGFISDARQESIEALLEMAEYKKSGNCICLVAAGCLSQKYAGELIPELPEVDIYIGTGDIPALPEILKNYRPDDEAVCRIGDPNNYLYNEALGEPLLSAEQGHTAYVKIAEGCDNRCTYCVIPSLRGAYRSRKPADIVNEVSALAKRGAREVILVAQDTTNYGIDLSGKYMLPQLLKEIAAIPELAWIRFLYGYPDHITDELLQTVREESKICPYFDIPLQHISDRILRAMGRLMSAENIKSLLKKIREQIPDAALRTTFIIGFPGETDEDFATLLSFLKEFKFDRVGFIAYSQEPETKAALSEDQVSDIIKIKRLETAMLVQQEIMNSKLAAMINQTLPVIVDGPSADYEGLWEGRTKKDAPEIDGVVYFHALKNTCPGNIVRVRITHSQEYALIGEILE